VIGSKARIGIIFGDGAFGCWVRADRIAKRLEKWVKVSLRPFGGEYRNAHFRNWYDDIYSWIQDNSFDLVIDDQALIGIMAARASKIPVISIIQHHPIWADTYGEAIQMLQFADRIAIPMWSWIGDTGLSSLEELKEKIVWTGPIFEELHFDSILSEANTLLVTEGSAKYDSTLFTIARQAAHFLTEWTIRLNEPRALRSSSAFLPKNCTPMPITDQFSQVLAKSQAVACAGGITMLEAIYCHKTPIVLPVPLQKEQAWTAEQLASIGLVIKITSDVKARAFAEIVRESVQDKPSTSFPLENGLDRLENIVKELLLCQF